MDFAPHTGPRRHLHQDRSVGQALHEIGLGEDYVKHFIRYSGPTFPNAAAGWSGAQGK